MYKRLLWESWIWTVSLFFRIRIKCIKQYYEIWPEMKNFVFRFLSSKKNEMTLVITIIWSPQCTHIGCFTQNRNILNTAFPILKDKCNCRFCHNYKSFTFHIHKILSILNVLSIYVKDRKFIGKNVKRERTYEQISLYCFKCIELFFSICYLWSFGNFTWISVPAIAEQQRINYSKNIGWSAALLQKYIEDDSCGQEKRSHANGCPLRHWR